MFKRYMRNRVRPAGARTDGATNFASAHRHKMLGSSDGLKCMHFCHIHLGGDRNTNLKRATVR